MVETPIIEVRSASFSYNKDNLIFEDLSFSIGKQEAFLIVGPNGCGKSTVIDSLLGLQKLSSGEVYLNGKSIISMKPKDVAECAAYVPQSHIKSFSYKVVDVVAMGRAYETGAFSAPDKANKEVAYAALKRVDMERFADRDYTKLSGGELQLVLIARALAQGSRLLVLDEPTAHLDFRHELNIMEIVADLIKTEGISVAMATHFLNQAYFLENAGVSTRVALMNNKTFKKVGTPTDILTPENLSKVFQITVNVAESPEDGRKFIMPLYNNKESK